jgi:UDP-N-acetylglucosamine--N-acetylmuramyl-(pentapeptide) pyrophosphoryl-undecaprenol N-acetylglucosamine transferase
MCHDDFYSALRLFEAISKTCDDASAHFGIFIAKYGLGADREHITGNILHSCKRRNTADPTMDDNMLRALSFADDKAKKVIKEFNPDIVIGTGGYACWPALSAAAEMGIPTVVHESNAIPGMAVRKLQNKVDVVLTNFESTAELLSPSANVVNVGNPLRAACSTITKAEARAKLGIDDSVKLVTLSFGGSLGAPAINRAACEMMAHFAKEKRAVKCFHVGGKRYYDNACNFFAAYDLERDNRFVLMEYTSDLPLYMAAADVVICRAGAMTLTEIARMGKASIIIPSPNVADNHQYKNAKALSDRNAAVVICEDDLNTDGKCHVCEYVDKLYEDDSYRNSLSENIRKFAKDDVEKNIFETIEKLLNKKRK